GRIAMHASRSISNNPKAWRSSEGVAPYTAPLLKRKPSASWVEQQPPTCPPASRTATGYPLLLRCTPAESPDRPAPITIIGSLFMLDPDKRWLATLEDDGKPLA